MKNLSNLANLKKILNKYNFTFTKSLGQNFIINPDICPMMADACMNFESKKIGILEVGPGIGTLTECLAIRFDKIISVEIDKKLIPILTDNLSGFDNVEIINEDILKLDLNKIIKEKFCNFDNITVCANLPYYITSDIIMYLLENNFNFDKIVIMIQKEVAERICAEPGTRICGAITLAVRCFGEPKILFNVNKSSFLPAPKVDSTVIEININKTNLEKIIDKKMFFKLISAGFNQRRKNLANSLSQKLNIPKANIINILEKNNINLNYRAENLKFEDWINLSNDIFLKLRGN